MWSFVMTSASILFRGAYETTAVWRLNAALGAISNLAVNQDLELGRHLGTVSQDGESNAS
jgi:hypothetical protein